MSRLLPLVMLSVAWTVAPARADCEAPVRDAELLHRALRGLTATIIHDVFSPPVASRIYVYSSIAAHETLAAGGEGAAPSLAGRVRELTPPPAPEPGVCTPAAALVALLEVGRALTFSEDLMTELRTEVETELRRRGLSEDELGRAAGYGTLVAKHVLKWAGGDKYKESRSWTRYDPRGSDDRWVPTGPDYMEAVEPNWSKIRTLALDHSDQYPPPPPPEFSTEPSSRFYREALEVYETSRKLDAEQRAIARFWDCNPFASNHIGHLMVGIKKMSPGGHWMSIATIAARQSGASFAESAWIYSTTSIALFDGFISCWMEKYRSEVIRPETYIGRNLDAAWQPLLQTPPFPEYTSGHSVISNAAATVLTALLGPEFAFLDNSEDDYGLPARPFPSFLAAAEEAAISRLYGGIHYRAAIENGVAQGRAVGRHVVERLELAPLKGGGR